MRLPSFIRKTRDDLNLLIIFYESIQPERFKTRAAHIPIPRDERSGMQRATLGKSCSDAAP